MKFGFGKNIIVIGGVYVIYMKYEKIFFKWEDNVFRGIKKICKELLLVGFFYFKVIVYYFEYLINYFVVISLLINIYFLELFLFGDVFCVVGKININGIMIIVLCFCMD